MYTAKIVNFPTTMPEISWEHKNESETTTRTTIISKEKRKHK